MKKGKVKTRWEDSHAAAQKTTNGATADDLIKRIGAKTTGRSWSYGELAICGSHQAG